MAFGLTSAGFIPKRLQDIKAELEAAEQQAFGLVNVGPDSVFGQLNGIYAKIAADLWELTEMIYNSLRPSAAEGVNLDNLLQYVGLARLPATRSTVTLVLYGTASTVVPSGSLVKTTLDNIEFATLDNVTISGTDAVDAELEAITGTAVAWQVTIDGALYSVPYNGGYTAHDAVIALIAVINAGTGTMTAAEGSAPELIRITSDDGVSGHLVVEGATVVFSKIGTPAEARASETGPQDAPIGAIDTIVTPIAGWDTVSNLVAATAGSDVETDTAARLRREVSFNRLGAGTVEAIRSRLVQEVDNVTSCVVFENIDDIEVDGRPPHSFEAVVVGGSESDIAAKIWLLKPAGIKTHGNINGGAGVQTPDSTGEMQVIEFSRPLNKHVFIHVTYSLYDEETFPVGGAALIAQAIKDYGDTLPLGKDIILQRFFEPIFSVPGIESVIVEIAIADPGDPDPTYPGDYVTSDQSDPRYAASIAIGTVSIAVFDLGRIIVSPAP